jgi:predicted ATPase
MQDLQRLPLVQHQGDGIRSFIGIMLTLVAASYPIVLIDEPEAFLHPPQARLLGRKLAAEARDRAQVIIATHSIDVLLGLLDADDASVTIARLTRQGDVNPVAVLSPDQLRELWRDPLLRYSNVLDGLFHRGVVL